MLSIDRSKVITRDRIIKTNIFIPPFWGRGLAVLLTHMDAWLICTLGLDLA